MPDDEPLVALRSGDGALIEEVRAVVVLADLPLVVHPPAAPPPPRADLLLDSASEWSPQDPSWTARPHRSLWVSTDPDVQAPDGGACLTLPSAAEEVLARVRLCTRRRHAQVVGVVGARGGAGASALSAVLAKACADKGLGAALVDLDAAGAGIDLLLGIEHEPGLRWADLAGDRGTFPAQSLSMALPTWHGVRVLSIDWRGGIDTGPCAQVLDALAAGHDVLVLDLPRAGMSTDQRRWAQLCDVVLVLATCDVIAAAGVQAARRELDGQDLRLVVRGPAPGGLTPAELAATCGLPLALHMRPERSLAAAIERGVAPGEQRRGPLMRGARQLVAELGLAT